MALAWSIFMMALVVSENKNYYYRSCICAYNTTTVCVCCCDETMRGNTIRERCVYPLTFSSFFVCVQLLIVSGLARQQVWLVY